MKKRTKHEMGYSVGKIFADNIECTIYGDIHNAILQMDILVSFHIKEGNFSASEFCKGQLKAFKESLSNETEN